MAMATNSELLSRRNQAMARGVASMHPRFALRGIKLVEQEWRQTEVSHVACAHHPGNNP